MAPPPQRGTAEPALRKWFLGSKAVFALKCLLCISAQIRNKKGAHYGIYSMLPGGSRQFNKMTQRNETCSSGREKQNDFYLQMKIMT